jgi:hypothetical protein
VTWCLVSLCNEAFLAFYFYLDAFDKRRVNQRPSSALAWPNRVRAATCLGGRTSLRQVHDACRAHANVTEIIHGGSLQGRAHPSSTAARSTLRAFNIGRGDSRETRWSWRWGRSRRRDYLRPRPKRHFLPRELRSITTTR